MYICLVKWSEGFSSSIWLEVLINNTSYHESGTTAIEQHSILRCWWYDNIFIFCRHTSTNKFSLHFENGDWCSVLAAQLRKMMPFDLSVVYCSPINQLIIIFTMHHSLQRDIICPLVWLSKCNAEMLEWQSRHSCFLPPNSIKNSDRLIINWGIKKPNPAWTDQVSSWWE